MVKQPEHNSKDIHAVTESAGHGEESVAASLGLNTQLFVFQLINFVIVGIIVWFMILKPLVARMEERKKLVDESIDKAKEIETNLTMSEQKYQEKLDEAKAEANTVIEKAHTDATDLATQLKEKAQKDIESLVSQAKKNIATEKKEAIDESKKEIGTLVVAAVEKIIADKLDKKSDAVLVERVITEVSKKA